MRTLLWDLLRWCADFCALGQQFPKSRPSSGFQCPFLGRRRARIPRETAARRLGSSFLNFTAASLRIARSTGQTRSSNGGMSITSRSFKITRINDISRRYELAMLCIRLATRRPTKFYITFAFLLQHLKRLRDAVRTAWQSIFPICLDSRFEHDICHARSTNTIGCGILPTVRAFYRPNRENGDDISQFIVHVKQSFLSMGIFTWQKQQTQQMGSKYCVSWD